MLATLVAMLLSNAAAAQERSRLGYGRLLTNDAMGDNADRWRTGSVATSRVWGPEWDGDLPSGFGQLLELRLGAEIISPAALINPDPRDRPYAGALSAGLHTHFAMAFADVSLGADLVATGPATQLDELQGAVHDLLGVSQPSAAVVAAQIENGLHPTLVFEAGRDLALGQSTTLRPFVEARAGIETYARAGFDLVFGEFGKGELLIREPVTGHRYRVVRQDWSGTSFILGADIAHVDSSELLPAERGIALEQKRERFRAGVQWQNKNGLAVFYGLTYLSEEFQDQPEGQLLGSVRLHLRF